MVDDHPYHKKVENLDSSTSSWWEKLPDSQVVSNISAIWH